MQECATLQSEIMVITDPYFLNPKQHEYDAKAWVVGAVVCVHKLRSQERCYVWGCLSLKSKFTHHIKTSISELNLAIPGHMKNSVEDLIVLKRFIINGNPKPSPKITDVYWTPSSWMAQGNTDVGSWMSCHCCSRVPIFVFSDIRIIGTKLAPLWLLWVRKCVYSLLTTGEIYL